MYIDSHTLWWLHLTKIMSASSLFRHYNMAPTGPLLSKIPKTIQTHTQKMHMYSRCFLPCSVSSCQIQPQHLGEEKMWHLYWVLVCVMDLPLGHSLWSSVIFKCVCTSCVLTSDCHSAAKTHLSEGGSDK